MGEHAFPLMGCVCKEAHVTQPTDDSEDRSVRYETLQVRSSVKYSGAFPTEQLNI